MWVRSLKANMTEHSGQQANPADTLRRVLDQQGALIQGHDTALREFNIRLDQTNQTLQELAGYLREATPRAEPAQLPVPEANPPIRSEPGPSFPEFRPSLPEKFSSLPSKCKGFLFQCKLILNTLRPVSRMTREK